MTINDDYADFWIEEEILHFIYKPNTIIDLEAARIVVKARLRYQDGVPYPILCDMRHLAIANKAARNFLAEKGCFNALAVALVIDEEYAGTLTQAFIKISNPAAPTRVFTDIPEAISFLADYK